MSQLSSKSFLIVSVAVLGLWMVSVADVSAATYYVATTGNDSHSCEQAKNQATPRRTINQGVKCLSGGDTLRVKSGTYVEALLDPLLSGTSASQPTTIEGDPAPNWPVLRPTERANGGVIAFLKSRQHLLVKNIVFDSRSLPSGHSQVISVGDARITFENFEAIGSTRMWEYGRIVTPYEGSVATFRNCKIHGGVSREGKGTDVGVHGFYWGGSNGLVENCEIYNNDGYAIQFYNGKCTDCVNNNIFRNNYVYNNRVGIYMARGYGNKVYNNIIANNEKRGVWFTVNKNYLYNNTIYGNKGPGIHLGSGSGEIRNNIVYQNAGGNIIAISGSYKGGIAFSNNLCGATSDYCAIGTNPQFINPSANNFRLHPSSPAINAGTTLPEVPCDFDGNRRPAGQAYDIGAYEYNSSPGGNCQGGATAPISSPTPTPPPKPIISLWAMPNPIQQGQSSLLQWSVQNATNCTASGGWSGSKPTSGSQSVSPSQTSLYTLSCSGPGGTASETLTLQVGASGPCHTITNTTPGSAIPSGFGVPWDVFSSSRPLIITATCTTGGIVLDVNTPPNPQYPYRYSYKTSYYVMQGQSQWNALPLTGAGLISNAWFPQKAAAVIPATGTNGTGSLSGYAVAYMCTWANTRWACGCRDSACTQSYWQIQQIRR